MMSSRFLMGSTRQSAPWLRALFAGLVFAMVGGVAYADDAVTSQLEGFEVIKKDGVETFQPSTVAAPGQVIEYRITYQNTTSAPVSGLIVVDRIPQGTVYISGSAHSETPHTLKFSADYGRVWQSEPVKRHIKGADGKSVEVVVPPEQYTNVEWLAKDSLLPGKPQVYVYRVKVKP